MSGQYSLVRVKRDWVPEWLFAIMAVPIDFITPKWLPFRYIITRAPKTGICECGHPISWHVQDKFECISTDCKCELYKEKP